VIERKDIGLKEVDITPHLCSGEFIEPGRRRRNKKIARFGLTTARGPSNPDSEFDQAEDSEADTAC